MSNVSKFSIDGNTIDVKDSTAREEIGSLANLTTTVKTDLVGAINEVNAKDTVSITYDSTTETLTITQ